MLFIVMHNDQRYLDRLTELATQEQMNDFTILREKDVGFNVMGASASCVFTKGHIVDAYQKAFVLVVKGREKLLHFIDVVEHDSSLKLLNIHSKGFMCAVPFQSLISLRMEGPPQDEGTTGVSIVDLLNEKRIIPNMQSSTKEEAINELARSLENASEITDLGTFVSDVFARELLCTTGIGNHLAIPHARSTVVKDIVVALGTSQDGIKFGAFDKKPAKIILLMGTPKAEGMNEYLKLLAHVTRIFKKKKIQDMILTINNPKKMITELKNIASKT